MQMHIFLCMKFLKPWFLVFPHLEKKHTPSLCTSGRVAEFGTTALIGE
ncbi:hypothetical protein SAMN05421803_11775 [Nocardiopsis flavescens]|uniref:Uncharacterized protein n=1 Tax=Nocardiopsis flavescens TaxID=758803 RepID=A0A1M6REJ3_9ACTN|nr:hypothetical protein SAMN05421803_11775 [Nocardiopsis flavescens]